MYNSVMILLSLSLSIFFSVSLPMSLSLSQAALERRFVDLRERARRLEELLGTDGVLLYPPHPLLDYKHHHPLFKPLNFAYTGSTYSSCCKSYILQSCTVYAVNLDKHFYLEHLYLPVIAFKTCLSWPCLGANANGRALVCYAVNPGLIWPGSFTNPSPSLSP